MTRDQHNRINERIAMLERENAALRRQVHENTEILAGLAENIAVLLAESRTAFPATGTACQAI